MQSYPVAIIGAGPIGLAAAANLVERGLSFTIIEAGSGVGAAIREWGHVQLFSPWQHCIDPASRRLLEATGWTAPPDNEHPTGRDLVDLYLEPLSGIPQIADSLQTGTRVTSVSRLGVDKTRPLGRDELPFVITAVAPVGEIEILASSVIDASGTWRQPNPLGSGGTPALGERASTDLIATGIPDVLADRDQYAGGAIAVVGSGHSAQNVLRALASVAADDESTQITWLVRRDEPGQMFGGGTDDELPERGALGSAAKALVSTGPVDLVTGFRIREVIRDDAGAWLVSLDGRKVGPFDRIVNTTGFRPDLAMLGEIQLDIDNSLESSKQLAPLIDPNFHSCGNVPPHGARELAQPDKGFFIVGNKSYGRAPTFLLLTGYEQARSVVALIDGDEDAAYNVKLVLPETGVCSPAPQSSKGMLPILENACC